MTNKTSGQSASEATSAQDMSGQSGLHLRERAAHVGSIAGEKLRAGSEAARAAGGKAVDGAAAYPVAALVGGLALGVVLGALLPRTRQEEELLGSLGSTINDKAKGAAAAAREAGQAKLGELGISKDAAGEQVGKLIESLATVAEHAGSAAVQAVRH